jgi:hypothetical protein
MMMWKSVAVAVALLSAEPALAAWDAQKYETCNHNAAANVARFQQLVDVMKPPGATAGTAFEMQRNVVDLCMTGVPERDAFRSLVILVCPGCR